MRLIHTSDGGLAAFERRLERTAMQAPTAFVDATAVAVEQLADEGFAARRSPQGQPWAPRVSGGAWPLLEKSGRMRASRRVRKLRNAVEISYNTPAEFHQNARRMAARRLLPGGKPSLWNPRIQEANRATLRRLLTEVA